MTTNLRVIKYARSMVCQSPTSRGEGARMTFLWLVTAIALIALGGGGAQGQMSPALQAKGVVYTADEYGNSISAVDLATGRVTVAPIPISPHNVQITADGTRLLAVGEPTEDAHGHSEGGSEPSETNGRLLVFDTADLASGPIADIEVGTDPAHVVADSQGQRAFVTNSGDDAVSVVDLVHKAVTGTIGTGRYPHGLRISPNGREIYVANVKDGTLSAIDLVSLTEVKRIQVGNTPVQVGFTPDGGRIYVSLRDENRVAVVDTASRTIIGKIDVGPKPIQVHATPEGRFVYVANQGTESDPADTVSVIETATGKVIDTIRTGKGAHGVSVSDDGAFIFVTNIVDSTLSVIDTVTRKVVATFSVGGGPNGVTYQFTPSKG